MVLLSVLCLPLLQAQNATVADADSVGRLWVITVDLSGSMIDKSPAKGLTTKERAASTARIVEGRLQQCWPLERIDFQKDRFLFFTSGYLNKNLKRNEPPFDSCFIHHTDSRLHAFSSKQEVISYIGRLLDHSKYYYKYKQSFVSQIETFSLVKASRFLKRQKTGTQFSRIVLVSLTDDAEGTLQWRNDLKYISSRDPKKVTEIGDVTKCYVYNELTGQGAGKVEELYFDDGWHVHVKVSECQSLSAHAQSSDGSSLFGVSARDGATIALEFPAQYKEFPIVLYYIDSIAINGKMYRLDKRYPAGTTVDTLRIPYANENHENRFEIFGSVQVAYDDPIFGAHYRKVHFSQMDELMSEAMVTHIVNKVVAIVLTLALAVWLLFFYIPRIKLFTLTVLSTRYVVRRGYRWNWKRAGTLLFACRRNGRGIFSWFLCARTRRVQVEMMPEMEDSVLTIVSPRALDFNVDMNGLGQGDLPLVEYECKEMKQGWNRYCYELNIVGKGGYIAFRLPQLGKVVFLQVVAAEREQLPPISRSEYSVLNEYYRCPPAKRSDAVLCSSVEDGDVVWSVLLPEYDDGVGLPLLRVRRLFAFRQKGGAADGNMETLAQLLVMQVKKYQPHCKHVEIRLLKGDSDTSEFSNNSFRLELVDAPCHGFICLREDTEDRPHYQVLYSPMGEEGLKREIPVATPRLHTGNGFIYQSFLPLHIIETLPAELQVGLVHKFDRLLNFDVPKTYERIIFENNTISYNLVQSQLIQ